MGLNAGNFTMGTGVLGDPVHYGTENTGIGYMALNATTTGHANTAIGNGALVMNTT